MSKAKTEQWKSQLLDSIKKCALRGDYKTGLAWAREGLKRSPEDFDFRYQYAKMLGDWADELPPGRKSKYKHEAIAILKPLTRALSGKDFELRFGLCLNYYYQSADFLGMSRWGARVVAQGQRRGHYAQGLGCALYADELRRKGSGARARGWAEKSVRAWKRYGLAGEKYYFPHYVQALALAILGREADALASLKRAAKLSKRTIDDWEFADVLGLIRGAAA